MEFLSPHWFRELGLGVASAGGSSPGRPGLVVEMSVADAPTGTLRYQLVVESGRVRVVVVGPAASPAQLRLACDYTTLSEIASGALSALDALVAGRAKLDGEISALDRSARELAGLDLVPAPVRRATTY